MKPAQSYIERRAFGRRETNIKATVRAGHRMYTCTIRDISEGGALLEFAEPVELPPRLWLRWEDTPSEIICEIRRNAGKRVGVEFARPISLAPRHTTAPAEVVARTAPPPLAPPPSREGVQQTPNRAADLVARHRSAIRKSDAPPVALPSAPSPARAHSPVNASVQIRVDTQPSLAVKAPPPLPAASRGDARNSPSIEVELASISERLGEIAMPASPAIASRTAHFPPAGPHRVETSVRLEPEMAVIAPAGLELNAVPDAEAATDLEAVSTAVPQCTEVEFNASAEPMVAGKAAVRSGDPAFETNQAVGEESQSALLAALELVDAETLKAFIEFDGLEPVSAAPFPSAEPHAPEPVGTAISPPLASHAPVPLAASAYWIVAAPDYLLPPWPLPAGAYIVLAVGTDQRPLPQSPLPQPPLPLAARLYQDITTRAPWPLPATAYG